jgi:hypothetical protein
MSEEYPTSDPMELQKRLTDAANRRDLDAMMAFYAPDGVYDRSRTGMGVLRDRRQLVASSRTGGAPTRSASSSRRRRESRRG